MPKTSKVHFTKHFNWAQELFGAPYRIFFLSSALAAVFLIPTWLALFRWGDRTLITLPPLSWHVHEMLGGFLVPAIAGFILTAVANWTRTNALCGWKLFALWSLWLAGRLAMALGAHHRVLAIMIDLAFMPILTFIVARRVWHARQSRQSILVLILTLFWLFDLGFHLSGSIRFLYATVLLAATLIVVIGGRITPTFTANWLRRQGRDTTTVRRQPWLDHLCVVACLILVLSECAGYRPVWLTGPVALLTALALLFRVIGWSGWSTREEPLLWILHVGHLWLVVGFGLFALAAFSLVPSAAWLHALGAGAMATMILGVMTRVTVAHTGRPLQLVSNAIILYLAIVAAGLLRVMTALGWIPFWPGLFISGSAWSLAFVLFLWHYLPILCTPPVGDNSVREGGSSDANRTN